MGGSLRQILCYADAIKPRLGDLRRHDLYIGHETIHSVSASEPDPLFLVNPGQAARQSAFPPKKLAKRYSDHILENTLSRAHHATPNSGRNLLVLWQLPATQQGSSQATAERIHRDRRL